MFFTDMCVPPARTVPSFVNHTQTHINRLQYNIHTPVSGSTVSYNTSYLSFSICFKLYSLSPLYTLYCSSVVYCTLYNLHPCNLYYIFPLFQTYITQLGQVLILYLLLVYLHTYMTCPNIVYIIHTYFLNASTTCVHHDLSTSVYTLQVSILYMFISNISRHMSVYCLTTYCSQSIPLLPHFTFAFFLYHGHPPLFTSHLYTM